VRREYVVILVVVAVVFVVVMQVLSGGHISKILSEVGTPSP
jgi:Flp pilus assembly pilin Flp